MRAFVTGVAGSSAGTSRATCVAATDAKAHRELGYAPRDLEAGLAATFR